MTHLQSQPIASLMIAKSKTKSESPSVQSYETKPIRDDDHQRMGAKPIRDDDHQRMGAKPIRDDDHQRMGTSIATASPASVVASSLDDESPFVHTPSPYFPYQPLDS